MIVFAVFHYVSRSNKYVLLFVLHTYILIATCNIAVIAPRGRTFEEFKADSLYHGWPSFNPEEMVSENVILHPDGRMESLCLAHLGHNLPKGGVDRYCVSI